MFRGRRTSTAASSMTTGLVMTLISAMGVWVLGAGCGGSARSGPMEVQTTPPRPTTTSAIDVGDCTAQPLGDAPKPLDRTGVGSAVALADWGDRTVAFVADPAARAVAVVDVDAARVLDVHGVEGEPSVLVVTKTGRIIVALRDRSALAVVVTSGSPVAGAGARIQTACRRPTPAEPTGLALDEEHERLVVVGATASKLAVMNASTLKTSFELDLPREPRAVAVVDGGRTAVVSHAVGSVASVIDLQGRQGRAVPLAARHEHELKELSTKIGEEVGQDLDESAVDELRELLVEFEEGIEDEGQRYGGRRRALQGYAVAATSAPRGRVLLPQVLVDPVGTERRTDGYGDRHVLTELPSVAVIDPRLGAAMQSSLRVDHRMTYRNEDEPERCLLPRAAVVDDETGSLLVACLGSDLVVAYDALAPEPAGAERRRWRVAAGPAGVALDRFDRRAVVWSRFDRVLSILPLGGGPVEASEGDDERSVRRVELGPSKQVRSLELALGEALFHATNDARIARDGRACASCHPDGRDDGLVWSTPDGPRRTLALAGRIEGTAPYGWDGSDRDLAAHLREALERLGGVGGLRSLEQRALIRYLRELPVPPSRGGDAATLRRGQEIFESKQAGCADCHRGSTLQDGERHDVGSRTRIDSGADFDTPSLRFLPRGGPYFHDGRYATLEALLEDEGRKMGHTAHLSKSDRRALIIYLESL